MDEQYEAVTLILDQLKTAGLAWFRHSIEDEDDYFRRPKIDGYAVFDGGEVHTIGRKRRGSFPTRKILLIEPHSKEARAVLGLWLRWDFDADPVVFRLFLGQWSLVAGSNTFAAFRFEAPERGDAHNYFHCQPCMNFGDKAPVEDAALLSERFPTIPINANNIVELTICAVMSAFGLKKTKAFMQRVLRESAANSNSSLTSAYAKLCKV